MKIDKNSPYWNDKCSEITYDLDELVKALSEGHIIRASYTDSFVVDAGELIRFEHGDRTVLISNDYGFDGALKELIKIAKNGYYILKREDTEVSYSIHEARFNLATALKFVDKGFSISHRAMITHGGFSKFHSIIKKKFDDLKNCNSLYLVKTNPDFEREIHVSSEDLFDKQGFYIYKK